MLAKKFFRRLRSLDGRVAAWVRIRVLAGVALLVRTDKRKWRKVARAGRPEWDHRNELISGFIPTGSSVLDIGCGAQTLKSHLKPGCRYQPCDVIKSSPEVIFCDFNAGVYPDTAEQFDCVVCSGVLEYIRKPREFLRRISQFGGVVILSYNPLPPGGSKIKRLGNGWGWVNHFTRSELEAVFSELDLNWTILHIDRLDYLIYSLGSAKTPAKPTNLAQSVTRT